MAIKGYIASSVDGYIASSAGQVDFLADYQHIDCGYDAFIADIDTIVMGRKTYEAILSFGVAWPYPEQKTWVLSSHAGVAVAHTSIQLWAHSLDVLIAMLKRPESGNTWVVGGAQLQAAFIDKRALDSLEVYVMPVILGSGIALFPAGLIARQTIKQLHTSLIDGTIIKHIYQFDVETA